jgi:hypothetical protein
MADGHAPLEHTPSRGELVRSVAVGVLLVWWRASLVCLGMVATWCAVGLAFGMSFTEEGARWATVMLVALGLALGFVGPWSLAGGFLGVFLAEKTTGIEVSYEFLIPGFLGWAASKWIQARLRRRRVVTLPG